MEWRSPHSFHPQKVAPASFWSLQRLSRHLRRRVYPKLLKSRRWGLPSQLEPHCCRQIVSHLWWLKRTWADFVRSNRQKRCWCSHSRRFRHSEAIPSKFLQVFRNWFQCVFWSQVHSCRSRTWRQVERIGPLKRASRSFCPGRLKRHWVWFRIFLCCIKSFAR